MPDFFIESPEALKRDAIRRDYGPGAIVILVNGRTVELTSWPFFDGDDADDRQAIIYARLLPGDPGSNVPLPYFSVMRRIGYSSLDAYEARNDLTDHDFIPDVPPDADLSPSSRRSDPRFIGADIGFLLLAAWIGALVVAFLAH